MAEVFNLDSNNPFELAQFMGKPVTLHYHYRELNLEEKRSIECVIVCFDVERDQDRVLVFINTENEFCKISLKDVFGLSIEYPFLK